MLGLTALSSAACVHLEASDALRRTTVAAAATHTSAASFDSARSEESARSEAAVQGEISGLVDVSELPTVLDEPAPARTSSFMPGPMFAATEASSWLAEDFAGPVAQIELHNACGLDLDYVFAPTSEPGDADQGRRGLDAHTIQTQVIPAGHWLHLWDGEAWLAAAVTTVDGGVMEVAATCDTLEVRFDLPEQGPTRFAVHWELGVDIGAAPPSAAPAESEAEAELGLELELALDEDAGPEAWGPEDLDRIELRLANLCADPVHYAFTPTVDDDGLGPDLGPDHDRGSTLAGHSQRSIEVPAGWWLRYQPPADLDGGWRGGATTSLGGAVVWLSSNCIDHGISDGQVIGLGG